MVWVPDKELAWVAAEVVGSDGNSVQLVTDSGKKVSFIAQVLDYDDNLL